jgi:hypothetical protein
MEVWKDIDGFDGMYQVSNLGRVYSTRTGKILKQIPRRHGYLSVWLYGTEKIENGRNGKAYSVHRLVAEAFIDNPNGKPIVHHRDLNRKNNNVSNLQWVTEAEHTALHNKIRAERYLRSENENLLS